MSAKKIIPAVVVDRVGGFAVNGDVDGLVAVEVMARLGIQLDDPDEAEVSPVGDPQPAIGGIEQEPGINGVAVLDAVRRGDDVVVIPSVVGGIGVERLAPHHMDRAGVSSPQTAAGRGIGHIVTIPDVDEVGGRPAPEPGLRCARSSRRRRPSRRRRCPKCNTCHRTARRSRDRGCRVRRPEPMPDQTSQRKSRAGTVAARIRDFIETSRTKC